MESRSIQQHTGSCILTHCKGLYVGLSLKTTRKLQPVQNVVTGAALAPSCKFAGHFQGQTYGKCITVIELGCDQSPSHWSKIPPLQQGAHPASVPSEAGESPPSPQLQSADQLEWLGPGEPPSCKPTSSVWVQLEALRAITHIRLPPIEGWKINHCACTEVFSRPLRVLVAGIIAKNAK